MPENFDPDSLISKKKEQLVGTVTTESVKTKACDNVKSSFFEPVDSNFIKDNPSRMPHKQPEDTISDSQSNPYLNMHSESTPSITGKEVNLISGVDRGEALSKVDEKPAQSVPKDSNLDVPAPNLDSAPNNWNAVSVDDKFIPLKIGQEPGTEVGDRKISFESVNSVLSDYGAINLGQDDDDPGDESEEKSKNLLERPALDSEKAPSDVGEDNDDDFGDFDSPFIGSVKPINSSYDPDPFGQTTMGPAISADGFGDFKAFESAPAAGADPQTAKEEGNDDDDFGDFASLSQATSSVPLTVISDASSSPSLSSLNSILESVSLSILIIFRISYFTSHFIRYKCTQLIFDLEKMQSDGDFSFIAKRRPFKVKRSRKKCTYYP